MTRQMRNVKVWVVGLTMAGLTVTTAAQQPAAQRPATPAPPPVTDSYVVGQAKPPVDPGESVKDMTLEDAIQAALENNLALKVAKMSPQIQDYNLQSARASFKPVFAGTLGENHSSTVSTSLLDAVTTNRITQ